MGCGSCNSAEVVEKSNLPKSVQRAPEIIQTSSKYVNQGVEVFGILGRQHCFHKKPGDIPEVDEKLTIIEENFKKLLDDIVHCINRLIEKDHDQVEVYKTLIPKVNKYIENDLIEGVKLIGLNFNKKKFNIKSVRLAEFKGKKSCDRIKQGYKDLLELAKDIIIELIDSKFVYEAENDKAANGDESGKKDIKIDFEKGQKFEGEEDPDEDNNKLEFESGRESGKEESPKQNQKSQLKYHQLRIMTLIIKMNIIDR